MSMPLNIIYDDKIFASKGGPAVREALEKGMRLFERIVDSDELCIYVYQRLAEAYLEDGEVIGDHELLEIVRHSLDGIVVNLDVEFGTDMQFDPHKKVLSVNQDLVTGLVMETLDEVGAKKAVIFLAVKFLHEEIFWDRNRCLRCK